MADKLINKCTEFSGTIKNRCEDLIKEYIKGCKARDGDNCESNYSKANRSDAILGDKNKKMALDLLTGETPADAADYLKKIRAGKGGEPKDKDPPVDEDSGMEELDADTKPEEKKEESKREKMGSDVSGYARLGGGFAYGGLRADNPTESGDDKEYCEATGACGSGLVNDTTHTTLVTNVEGGVYVTAPTPGSAFELKAGGKFEHVLTNNSGENAGTPADLVSLRAVVSPRYAYVGKGSRFSIGPQIEAGPMWLSGGDNGTVMLPRAPNGMSGSDFAYLDAPVSVDASMSWSVSESVELGAYLTVPLFNLNYGDHPALNAVNDEKEKDGLRPRATLGFEVRWGVGSGSKSSAASTTTPAEETDTEDETE